ncbi:MAG: hypothetical protein WDN45_11610 [Caulobacteraceae bacterium]
MKRLITAGMVTAAATILGLAGCSKPAPAPSASQTVSFSVLSAETSSPWPRSGSPCSTTCTRPPA